MTGSPGFSWPYYGQLNPGIPVEGLLRLAGNFRTRLFDPPMRFYVRGRLIDNPAWL